MSNIYLIYTYYSAIKEKSHLFQEELESKKKQIERYDKKVIDLELEKLVKYLPNQWETN